LDWWARVDENVVELKSSEEYYRAADHYMKKKGVYPREVVLQMKEAETITSWEKRTIQPEILETLDKTRRKSKKATSQTHHSSVLQSPY
jgi:hypothetical protein